MQERERNCTKVKLMTSTDKERCFALLGKLKSCSLSEEETFVRLLQISSYKQKLEGLYRKVPIQRKSPGPLKMPVKMLIRILREQEVGQTREYNVNGLIFKVHVYEDTDLWRREICVHRNWGGKNKERYLEWSSLYRDKQFSVLIRQYRKSMCITSACLSNYYKVKWLQFIEQHFPQKFLAVHEGVS